MVDHGAAQYSTIHSVLPSLSPLSESRSKAESLVVLLVPEFEQAGFSPLLSEILNQVSVMFLSCHASCSSLVLWVTTGGMRGGLTFFFCTNSISSARQPSRLCLFLLISIPLAFKRGNRTEFLRVDFTNGERTQYGLALDLAP